MSVVVFLRGVNVGGHKTFRPSELAKKLARRGVRSIGAAGTFVVDRPGNRKVLRCEFLDALGFDAELMVCSAGELGALERAESLRPVVGPDVEREVSALAVAPRPAPRLPIERPEGSTWQVRMVRIAGRLVVSLRRRTDARLLYTNQVVEKVLGVPATMRNWRTISSVLDCLTPPPRDTTRA